MFRRSNLLVVRALSSVIGRHPDLGLRIVAHLVSEDDAERDGTEFAVHSRERGLVVVRDVVGCRAVESVALQLGGVVDRYGPAAGWYVGT
jgi:hypothetical protein